MKNRLIVFAVAFLSAQDVLAVTTVAEMVTSGGFTIGPSVPSGIRIQSDGTVIAFEGDKVTPLARLVQVKSRSMKTVISQLEAAPLQVENPESPACPDAPTVSYKVTQPSGKVIEIARKEACHNLSMPKGGVSLLREVLDGLSKLTYLK